MQHLALPCVLPAECHVRAPWARRPPGAPLPAPKLLFSRTRGLSVVIRASKGAQGGGVEGQPSYADMVQAREYELWQRQSRLYDQLMEQQERDRQHWEEERRRWAAQEASLRAELAELRAQLLYVLSAGSSVQARGSPASSSSSSVGSSAYVPPPQPPLAGRPAAQLPLGTAGRSAAEQIQAVVDAVKFGADPRAGGGTGAGGPWEGPAAEQGAMPRFATELAAAVAAVDELDVLADDLDFSALADRLAGRTQQQQQRAPAQEAQAAQQPAPAAAAAAAVAPPPAQPTAKPAPAAPEAPPAGPRPALVSGSDDIYWMNELHRALLDAGYYPGDDDIEDFFFGESTLSAVLTLQACEGLPETGVVDEATWQRLLGSQRSTEPSGSPSAAAAAAAVGAPSAGPVGRQQASKPYQELFAAAGAQPPAPAGAAGRPEVVLTDEITITDEIVVSDGLVVERVTVREEVVSSAASAPTRTTWPVLMEGDGGREVHALHVALEKNGYYASDDDMRWWQFGDSTMAALKTFQACSRLPEGGVCDPATWQALLGPGAKPSDIDSLHSGDSADEDLAQSSSGDRVWLMGEQRWEDRGRLKRRG